MSERIARMKELPLNGIADAIGKIIQEIDAHFTAPGGVLEMK